MAVCSNPSARRMLALALGVLLVGGACSASGKPRPSPFEPTPVLRPLPTATATPGLGVALPGPGTSANGGLAAAQQLLREGRFEEAAATFGVVAAISSGTVRTQALIGSSTAQQGEGNKEGALRAAGEAAATASPGSAEGIAAGYLFGVRLNEAARFAEAVTALRAVMSPTGQLSLYVAAEYGRALAGAGRGDEAAAAWDSLLAQTGLPLALRTEVFTDRANAARTAGDAASLARWLDALVALNGDAAATYERAQLARSSGDSALSARLLSALVATQPGSRLAVQAVAQLHDAGAAVDRGQEGLIYYRRGAYRDARVVLLEGIAEPGISAATLAFRLYYLAAAYEDAGIPAQALVYYDRAASAGGGDAYTHRAKYWAARVTERLGDAAAASDRYRALVVDGPAGEFTAEAAFRAGYTLLAKGDAAGAVAAWDAIGSGGGARVAYWKGRALASLGREREAVTLYQRAWTSDPLSFYGAEADRAALGKPPVDTSYRSRSLVVATDWDEVARWLAGLTPGTIPGSAPTAAAALAGVGLRAEAARVVNDAAIGAGPWRLFELAREAQSAGLVDVAAQLAERLRASVGAEARDVPKGLLRVLYPVDYVARLDAEAKAQGLDPLFLAALVRQESYWDASAGSGAGALGLAQVMPETGGAIARALGVPGFVANDLFRPALSLRFGAYYLGGQIKRFGQPWVALAAYNAGPGNAVRWEEAAGAGGAADFVEQVDFEETAHYVEIVMQHYAHYLRAYAE